MFKCLILLTGLFWEILIFVSPLDRNRPGGNASDMYLFNEAISFLGLVELPLKGRRFTWTNKQLSPLLERLHWFFTSVSWTTSYPNSFVSPLCMETSDHVPCVISISTTIPKQSIFRFENCWLQHESFYHIINQHWVAPPHMIDAAKILTAKFKNQRKALKSWKNYLSSLKVTIANVKVVLSFLILIEEFRDLSLPEWNFKDLLQDKLQSLLKQQKAY